MSEQPSGTLTPEDVAAFRQWQDAEAKRAKAGELPPNGALCNQCDYDSRITAKQAEYDAAPDEQGNVKTATREDSDYDEADPSADLLGAVDHNATHGHHLTVSVDGVRFQVNPRQG
jgi:hypothetical protein